MTRLFGEDEKGPGWGLSYFGGRTSPLRRMLLGFVLCLGYGPQLQPG